MTTTAARPHFRGPRRSRCLLSGATLSTTPRARHSAKGGWPDAQRSAFTFNARAALYRGFQLLDLRPGDAVLFPAYCCGVELDTLLKFGLRPVFYRLRADLVPDLDHLDGLRDPAIRALLVIHYFGLPQPMGALRELTQRRGLRLIEDCAHALFAMDEEGRPTGDRADLAAFSLRKHLPVPDGGLLIAAQRFAEVPGALRSIPWRRRVKSLAALIGLELEHRWPSAADRLRSRVGVPPRLDLADGEGQSFALTSRFEFDSVDWRMSRWTRGVLAWADAALIRARRLANFRRLAASLGDTPAVRPLRPAAPDGASPWVMPVLVEAPMAFCRFMARHHIEAFPVWRYSHPAIEGRPELRATELHGKVVALPVQHGLSDDDIARVIELIGLWQQGR